MFNLSEIKDMLCYVIMLVLHFLFCIICSGPAGRLICLFYSQVCMSTVELKVCVCFTYSLHVHSFPKMELTIAGIVYSGAGYY